MIDHYARNYCTNHLKKHSFPSFKFYYNAMKIVYSAGRVAKKTTYTAEDWVSDSYLIGQAIENIGANITIDGYENITNLDKPCVFVSNHMSTLETFLLPSIIQPTKDVTFIIKESLLKYPGFGRILGSRDPIALTRTNPREDLVNVLKNGQRILESGRSIIIFPQGTRFPDVNNKDFSTLGVKLAKKANVPIVPLALRTDAWGTGKMVKDLGFISPTLPIHFRFGQALEITGNGKEEHTHCMEFITKSVQEFIEKIAK